MSKKIADYSLEDNISALSEMFGQYTSAVYLRGSLLRREPPYDDVDLAEISDTDPHTKDDMPQSFRGAKVAYVHLRTSEWESYLRDCPRSWYMFYDLVTLRSEERSDTILRRERNEFFASKEEDYLAYNHFNHLATRNDTVDLSNNEYEYSKKIPGSKRSLMRTAFMLKALHPTMRKLTTPDLLDECAAEGYIPDSIPSIASNIYNALSNEPIDTSGLTTLTTKSLEWMDELSATVERRLNETLSPAYISLLGRAALSDSSDELISAYDEFHDLDAPYRQWTLAFFLTKNRRLPADVVQELGDFYRAGYIGRIIRDNLAARSYDPDNRSIK